MLGAAGCVLVVMGCVGFAGSICGEEKKRLATLKALRGILENMKYYIAYQKATVPEALWKLSDKKQNDFSESFEKIYQRVYEKGEDFSEAWKKEMGKAMQRTTLKGAEKELILSFPACLGFMEENAQAGALDELLREITYQIEELEGEQKNKNKVIMSLGAATGILVSILLL